MIRAALNNPYAVVAISLIVVILGVVSYQTMVVDIFPEINIPVVAVATFYKGMGPSEVEGAITLRLEQLFLQASYVEHIESRSLPGVSLIKVYFHPSYDENAGMAEITSLAYSTLRFLPPGIWPPIIIKFGAASLPIGTLTVSSETLSEKEVARAADSTIIQTNIVRINGHRAVYLPIMKQAGANTIQVIDGIKATLPKLIGLPEDLTVNLIFDQSLYIRQAIQTLEEEGLLGGGLACLMVLLFLGSLRSTVIIALAIPLSILAAFVLLYFTGHTVNVMTLGGLALVIGTLLDNNIVVLENVHRHLGMGKTPGRAADDGTREVALPMLVATISILIVYLPIMFFTGIVKFLFVPLALAVAYVMVVSYLTSMPVAPVAMTALFREQTHAPADHPRLFDRLFGSLVDRYVLVLRWCLAHKALVVGVVTLTFGGSLLLAPWLATEFFPRVDAGQFILNVAAPEGTRVEKTEAIVGQIESLIRQEIPPVELDQLVANIGLPHGWMVLYTPVNGPHQAFLLVSLTRGHRLRTDAIIARLRARLAREFPGLKFSFQTGGVVSDVLNFGLPAPIDIKVSGPKLSEG